MSKHRIINEETNHEIDFNVNFEKNEVRVVELIKNEFKYVTGLNRIATLNLEQARNDYSVYLKAGYIKGCHHPTSFEDRCQTCGQWIN